MNKDMPIYFLFRRMSQPLGLGFCMLCLSLAGCGDSTGHEGADNDNHMVYHNDPSPEQETPLKFDDTFFDRPVPEVPDEFRWLLAAYPDHISHVEKDTLYLKDGTDLVYYDGYRELNADRLLDQAAVEDIYWWDYHLTDKPLAQKGEDPGRIRPNFFFAKMYGEDKAAVLENLTVITWLPSSANIPLRFTRVNGAADSLQAVSDELDQLPELHKYLDDPAGTFNYRKIAGTDNLSAHSWGIAIDINLEFSHYWRWSSEFKQGKPLRHRNQIPMEIVKIFEKHGFIWGGRWEHYDTMHFEFRPEFFVPEYRAYVEKYYR